MASSGNIPKGIFFGAVAGTLDVLPMVFMNLSWDANLSAFSMWVASGFLVSTSTLKLPGFAKGFLVSALLFLPVGILVGWNDMPSLLPMCAATAILGSALGHLLG